MKLATLPGAGPDGRLVVVSSDLSQAVDAQSVAPTLQAALDRWAEIEPGLRDVSAALDAGRAACAFVFEPATALAPMPRGYQWLDGSAFLSHGKLMTRAFNLAEDAADLAQGMPLMYQGLSDQFFPGTADAAFPSEADGIDFEAEYGVFLDEVPLGVTPSQAAGHIRLVTLINDWSLRALAPREMKTGFGFLQAKPPCSLAPIAITPDELGDAWIDGRVARPVEVRWNGEVFGRPDGALMDFSFGQLIAHAARTRRLVAGTLIGSGTVSNPEAETVGSACISERRALEMIASGGAPSTGFMSYGDRVRIESFDAAGRTLFGAIDQQVVAARKS